jgi:hypothetical protein
MSFEQFMNGGGEGMPWLYKGWRCIECGEVIDPRILLNRMKSKVGDEQEVGAGIDGGSD